MYKLYDIIFLVCCREPPDFYPIHESRIARLLGPSCSCSFTCHLISAFSARTPACDGLIIWPQGGKTAVWGEPMAQSIWKKTRLLKIYVWFFWYIHKSNYTRNVCFRQVSRYCWVFSQHSPTKKSQHSPTKKKRHKSSLPSHSFGGYTLTWRHGPWDFQQPPKIPRSNQISVKFFQVASTSGASPIQSCNLKGFKGSSDILVEKSGWTSPSSIFLSVTSCGGCLKGKQLHSNLCSFVKDQHYQTRIVLIRDIIAYPQYMPTTDIKSDKERGRKKTRHLLYARPI